MLHPLMRVYDNSIQTISYLCVENYQLSGDWENDSNPINPFRATNLFWFPLKTSENLWISDVFRGYHTMWSNISRG